MKVYIYKDERWPDYGYTVEGKDFTPAELSSEEMAFIDKAEEDYDKAQEILKAAHDKGN